MPDPSRDPTWYDELWVKYPLSSVPIPTLFPATYYAQLKFRIILKDLAVDITARAPKEKLSLQQRTDFYARLCAWYEELPSTLHAERITLPSQLGVQ